MNDDIVTPELIDDEKSTTGLVTAQQSLPGRLHVLPIPHRPYFPGQIQPLVVDAETWNETIERVSNTTHRMLGLCFVDQAVNEETRVSDFSTMGTLVRLHRISERDGKIQFIAQGIKRFRIVSWLSQNQPYLAEVNYPFEPEENTDEIKAYAMAIIDAIKELVPLNPLYGEELKQYLKYFNPNEPSPLCDFAAAITTAEGFQLQEILETLPILERMKCVLPLLHKELEIVRMQSEISEEVNRKVSKHQREFFLKEQLKIIQEELGVSKNDKTADIEDFQQRLENLLVPQATQKRIDEELKKLQLLETGSAEYNVTRNYLDWVTSVPWGLHSEDSYDLKNARTVLDTHHDGLEDIKDRIVEFLALGAYKKEISGSIMLLVGPPGVGKTSIGKSVAEALGRKFYRFSLGGMRDEAEIKGHRRTYIGAMPGKLVQALKEMQVSNPVIMLDEIDKIGASFQGDPASALLEVLDPEQNSDFLDHYLDLRVDLSKVLFICTANQLDSIPPALLDRMDMIRLSGYIAQEKLLIAKNHLWPKLLKRAGLRKSQLRIHSSALKNLIENYAREAGVRSLEKLLQRIIRKAVVTILQDKVAQITITSKDLHDYLGPAPFKKEKSMRGPGVVTGLAWTSMGGATLPIEACRVHKNVRGFKQTGQLGDVMRESAEIAYSYIAGNCSKYGIDSDYFDELFIHLHVPEGATPKDGPSAGITMSTALLSLAKNRQIRRPLAMTGELTLTGHVLPVGGIREKVIAAQRVNIKELILPEANRGDYEELPDYLRKGMTVHFAENYDDVAALVF
jgi:ATP-dependent Lon protease